MEIRAPDNSVKGMMMPDGTMIKLCAVWTLAFAATHGLTLHLAPPVSLTAPHQVILMLPMNYPILLFVTVFCWLLLVLALLPGAPGRHSRSGRRESGDSAAHRLKPGTHRGGS